MKHSGTELINPFKVLEYVGIQPGWHVADLGCGALGHFVFPAAQFVGGDGKVYAVDIDKAAVKAIERAAKFEQFWNIYPVWSDIEVVHAARIPNQSLDLTLVVNNLFLSKNKQGLVQEVVRLTKPGGKILVIEWKKDAKAVIGPAPENRMEVEEARAVFIDPELQKLEVFDVGDEHFGILFRKLEQCSEPHVVSLSLPTEEGLALSKA